MQWAHSIESRDPDKVLSLYHPEGSLWGTLSPVLRQGHADIREYFVKFLQWEELRCEFGEGHVRIYDNISFYSGSYVFTWKVREKKVTVPARFSFVFKKESDQWLILEHHSSLFPELPFKIRKYLTK